MKYFFKKLTEYYLLGLQECKYASCSYTEWSKWSARCGRSINRTRDLETEMVTSWRASCDGLPKDCTEHKEAVHQERVQTCKYI